MPRKKSISVPTISERVLEVIAKPINLAISNIPIIETDENSIERNSDGTWIQLNPNAE
jgi:hypothetical protein